MTDDTLAEKLESLTHSVEPALSDEELATLAEARDRLSDDSSQSKTDMTVTLRPRVDMTRFASDLRTLADEIETTGGDEDGV